MTAVWRQGGVNIPPRAINELLEAGDVVLLLDGLDEVPIQLSAHCIKAVRTLNHYKHTPFVITSRDAAWYWSLASLAESREMPQIDAANLLPVLRRHSPLSDALVGAIEGQPVLIDACKIPLWRVVIGTLVESGLDIGLVTGVHDVKTILLRQYCRLPRGSQWTAQDYEFLVNIATALDRTGGFVASLPDLNGVLLSRGGQRSARFIGTLTALLATAPFSAAFITIASKAGDSRQLILEILGTSSAVLLAWSSSGLMRDHVQLALRRPSLRRLAVELLVYVRVSRPIGFLFASLLIACSLAWSKDFGLTEAAAAFVGALIFTVSLSAVIATQQAYYRGVVGIFPSTKALVRVEVLLLVRDYLFHCVLGGSVAFVLWFLTAKTAIWPLTAPLGVSLLRGLGAGAFVSRLGQLDSWVLRLMITYAAAILTRQLPPRFGKFLRRAEKQSLLMWEMGQVCLAHRTLQEALARPMSHNSAADQILEQARAKVRIGCHQEATLLLAHIDIDRCDEHDTLSRLSEIFLAIGEYDNARKACMQQAAITKGGRRRVALSNAAAIAIQQNDNAAARSISLQAILADPASKSAHVYLAILDWVDGDTHGAMQNSRKSLRRGGSFVIGYSDVMDSIAWLILGNEKAALRHAGWAMEFGIDVRFEPLFKVLEDCQTRPPLWTDFITRL